MSNVSNDAQFWDLRAFGYEQAAELRKKSTVIANARSQTRLPK